VIALALTLGALAYLLVTPASKSDPSADERAAPPDEPVRLVGPYLVRVEPGSPLAGKLQIADLHPTRITAPVLSVTGTVVASLRPGAANGVVLTPAFLALAGGLPAGRSSDYWQFNAPEVLTTFTDWQKAKADITFTRMQLVRIREAAQARTAAQKDLVATMIKLEAVGSETKKQLAVEQATLRQYEIQEQKEVYEAEMAVRMAERNEAAAARQLQQAGLDPALLGSVTSDVDLVMADVPEGFLTRVKVGDGCEARFFGIPDQVFAGRVKSIAPVISKDRRSLRVLFTVDDLNDQLRPGMFAEIGLGTDPRDALLAPAEGVVHVGRTDYVLVAVGDPGVWRVTPVEVGEMREGRVEILKGLNAGDRVLGQGAILLKPFVAKAVQPGNGGRP
jgi:membrane fusion protein, heavy metal efflux system